MCEQWPFAPGISMTTNKLYYGDNLEILRRYIPYESVDLISFKECVRL